MMEAEFRRRLQRPDYAIGGLRAPATLVEAAGLPVDADDVASFDLIVSGGRIEAIAPPGSVSEALPGAGRMVLPCFADIHTHLDMGHMVDAWPNPEGTHFGAVKARDAYRSAALARDAAWRERDVEQRMDFALRCHYAHGSAAVRTHLDSLPEQADVSWNVFERVRERWRGKVELQGVSLLPADQYLVDFGRVLADRVAAAGGLLGAVTRLSGRGHGAGGDAQMQQALETLFRLAAERGLDVDLHVDETGDPAVKNFDAVARARLATGFKGRVVCGHCCSLAVRPPEEAQAAMALAREADLSVASLPQVNLFLQDRAPGRTPRWRGITLLRELRAAGIPVALGTDNVRDGFYAYGDHDLLATLAFAAIIGHLDRPLGDWPAAITRTPCELMGLRAMGRLQAGARADLLIFAARRYSELLSRPHSERILIRGGRLDEARAPDYAELDELASALR